MTVKYLDHYVRDDFDDGSKASHNLTYPVAFPSIMFTLCMIESCSGSYG